MRRLFVIHRHQDMDLEGTILKRKACRGIIYRNGKLLLIQSAKYGEVKFPGGGISENEKTIDALHREILEETGFKIKARTKAFGSTLELAKDFEGKYDIFMQDSRYYFCDIHPGQSDLQLDDYELEYGYAPVFLSLEEAISINRSLESNDLIPWKERDTLIMEMLRDVNHEN
ncbi:MAG: NUDIX domain-containing protein [Bacilli bacterium]|nr:NUDIX domain-containing protein [Bacilli bacterium]